MIRTEKVRRSLPLFINDAWPILEPSNEFLSNWHIDCMSEYLHAVNLGQIKRLIVNIPPRYMKPVEDSSLVLMADGRRVPLRDIKVGDQVITHTGRAQKVTAVHIQGELDCLRIEAAGRKVLAALDHPFLTPKGWVQAQHLQPEDFLASVVPELQLLPDSRPVEEFRLMGYFIGDGSTTGNAANITCADPEEVKDIIHCAATMDFNVTRIASTGSKTSCACNYSISAGSRPWLKSYDMHEKTSHTKRVPATVFSATGEQIANFIGAYFSCDGTIKKRPGVQLTFTSVSEGLLLDVQHLLLRFGIKSQVRLRNAFQTFVGEHYSYLLLVSGEDNVARFAQHIPVYNSKGQTLKDLNLVRTEFDKLLIPSKIDHISPAGKYPCRCLTVENDHSFTANDLVVKNSLQASVLWPTWTWIDAPSTRWLFASYSASLSTKHSLDRRQVIQSPWYQDRWGHIYQLAGDQNIKTEYANTKRGHMLATSVGGTATGKGGDIIVVDDPHNPMQAESDALREAAIEFFDRTLTTRLDNKKKGAIVVIMQRLHDLDLTGHLLKQNRTALEAAANAKHNLHIDEVNAQEWQELSLAAAAARELGIKTGVPNNGMYGSNIPILTPGDPNGLGSSNGDGDGGDYSPIQLGEIDPEAIRALRKEEQMKEEQFERLRTLVRQQDPYNKFQHLDPQQYKPQTDQAILDEEYNKMPLESNIKDNSNAIWTHLCLPAIAPKKTTIVFPLSGKSIEREEGDLLWPEREGKAELARVKISLGAYGFSGQYDQDPSPAGGGILKSTWWQYYAMLPSQKDIEMGVISIDCAFKDLASSDYACAQAWWKIGANRYLIDQIRGKWSFPILLTQLRLFIRKHEVCKYRLIEDKANGSAVIQTMKDEISGIIPVDPQGGKIARAHAVSPQVEAGNFWLPDPRLYPWVDDFTLECAKFPKGANDDQVDCFTQAGIYMEKKQFQHWTAKIPWL